MFTNLHVLPFFGSIEVLCVILKVCQCQYNTADKVARYIYIIVLEKYLYYNLHEYWMI